MIFIHSLVFGLEGRAWQEPEPSHVTGMAMVHCILGTFLGVVCHCFPLPLDVPTLAPGASVHNDARDPSSERWNCGRERCPVVILPKIRHPRKFKGSLTCRKSTTWDRRLYFSSEGRCAEEFLRPKNPTALAGFEPTNLGTEGQHDFKINCSFNSCHSLNNPCIC